MGTDVLADPWIISVDDLLISLVSEFAAVMTPVAQERRHPG